MKQKRAYRYRFYPTVQQTQLFARTFGSCRYVYNWALRLRTDAYYDRQERLYYSDLSAALTGLKKQDDKVWLNEVSSVTLQQTLRNLDRALLNFFARRNEYPNFRKKCNRQSAELTGSAFKWDGEQLFLAKMGGPLAIRWSRPLPEGSRPTTVSVSKDTADRYFVSILVEQDITHLPTNENTVGADLGLKDFVALSTGEKIGNPKFFTKDEKNLAKAQGRHAKKQPSSNNRNKARLKVARIHARIADRRRDFLHKLSTRLIRENQTVCVESLSVKNMVHNRSLSKAISDVGWGEFISLLEYKAEWYGRHLVKIDKWYPSSKRCFNCGHILNSLTLDVRHWTCPECGIVHDRDVNAAMNIKAAGLAVYNASGEAVRPGRIRSNRARLNEGRIPSFQAR